MNVTELARRVRTNTNELLEILPQYGFDIGKKAIKVDDRIAQQIIRKWTFIKKELEQKKREELQKKKELERALRKEKGKSVLVPAVIAVREFAARLEMPVTSVIGELMKNGILASLNERIDYDTAAVIAEDLGFQVKKEQGQGMNAETQMSEKVEEILGESTEGLQPRPPVVVVMGHVDHGKTKLLDAIRRTNVIDTESGGITQHIGAYQLDYTLKESKEKRRLTFIDTPGHEAFTVMRSRGARVADVAILVVAADDGVMPQTIEALNIIKAAKLPFIVAMNKIDKPEANPDKVKRELAEQSVQPEDWGGTVAFVPISAKQGLNVDLLLENIFLLADVEQQSIQANPNRPAAGTIIESHVDKGEGPVATVLIQTGTLKNGDPLVVNGKIYGTVRTMKDYTGDTLASALPSTPVKILGFKSAPEVGDILDVSSVGSAEKIRKSKVRSAVASTVLTTQKSEANGEEEAEERKRILNVFVKADTLGSLEAILNSLEKFQHEEVGIKIVGKGLGNITESDIDRMEATHAVVVAFKVVEAPSAVEHARTSGVAIQKFEVIYDLLNFVRDELEKLLPEEHLFTEFGKLKILKVFKKDKKTMTVGGRVIAGKILSNFPVRVWRADVVMGEGRIVGLQQGKLDTKEVSEGMECGILFQGKVTIEEGDVLESFSEQVRKRKIQFEK